MAYERLDDFLIEQGCLIIDPRVIVPKNFPTAPELNGLWSSAVIASYKLKESCGFDSEVFCGSAIINPSGKICRLMEIAENKQLFTATVVLPDEGGESKSAIVTLRAGEATLRFGIVSVNSQQEHIRFISQLTTNRTKEEYFVAGSKDNDGDYERLYENYNEALKLVENVTSWDKPQICDSCPVAK